LSSANQSDSTSILISTVSAGNQAVNNLLGEFASSSSTVKGTIRLQKQTDPSKWIVLAVTSVGAVQSAGDGNGYRVLAVTPVGASGVAPFGNTDSLLLHFQHTGDKGNNGASVLLAQATVGSAVANIDFLNTFSSLYDKYVIEVEGMGSSGASSQFQMRLANGGTVDSSAVYSTLSGGGVTLTLGFAEFTLTNNDQPAALNATIEVRNANSTGMKSVGARGSYVPSGGANHRAILGEGDYTKSSAVSGFRLFFSSGNITSGTVRVYGVINT
jgi:hypothetical protein